MTIGRTGGILRPQDVFATSLYTGNGANLTITNGIDLLGSGGLVWGKRRDAATSYELVDTLRGATNTLLSNAPNAELIDDASLSAFRSAGFRLRADGGINGLNTSNVAWSVRKAPKFFDIVTWTGNGVAGRQIPHALGVAPGMVIVKRRDLAQEWFVYHRTISAANTLRLQSTAATNTTNSATVFNSTAPTDTVFTVGTDIGVNAAGGTYVAYLFAHDPSADGIINCGAFAHDGAGPSGYRDFVVGWQPQFLLVKASNAAQAWYIVDGARGVASLSPDDSDAETANSLAGTFIQLTGSGFRISNSNFGGASFVFAAIRAPIL